MTFDPATFLEDPDTKCPTGKLRYVDQEEAEKNLKKLRRLRAFQARPRAPERQTYLCQWCTGWHLSSKPPELPPEHDPKLEDETWEQYAHRLERRIKEQRETLRQINVLRADAGNRAERKRIERLTMSLGRVTELWQAEQQKTLGLINKLRSLGEEPVAPTGSDQDGS